MWSRDWNCAHTQGEIVKSESTTAFLSSLPVEAQPTRANAPRSLPAAEVLNPLENSDWENLLATHPESGFFHSSAWANVLHQSYGYTPRYFAIRENNRLIALWPMMGVSSWLTGKRGVGLPFTDECPPIFPDAATAERMISEMTDYGRSRGWKYWECRGAHLFPENIPASSAYYGHELKLSLGQSVIYEKFKGSVRTAVRKAEKSGIQVEISRSWDALKAFYQLNCGTRQKHGLPPQPIDFFRCIYDNVCAKNLGTIALGFHNKQPISAAVFLHLGKKVIYKYGASDERFKDLCATNMVLWTAIQEFIKEGRESFHFGRSAMNNEGLRKFKLGWATEESTIKYVKYDLKQNNFVSDEPESGGWHNRVFSRMPQFLSRKVGAMLYKHVA